MKINCPYHDDKTASMEVYETHSHCFGCGAHVPVEKLGIKAKMPSQWQRKITSEDVDKSIEQISKYPRKLIRGLELPYNSTGYFIVYPGNKYYVKRLWEGTNANKYKCPPGQKTPLMLFNATAPKDLLVVIEGQMNALTANAVAPGLAVCSPGSANSLNRPDFVKYYLHYTTIVVIVDRDPPGVVEGIKLRDELLKHRKRVVLYPMQQDLNALYTTDGKEEAKRALKEALDML
jgi:DNA primase